jgi:hypothetical protein
MFDRLRDFDERLFSPPHTFETTLALVMSSLGITFGEEEPSETPSPREQLPMPTRP